MSAMVRLSILLLIIMLPAVSAGTPDNVDQAPQSVLKIAEEQIATGKSAEAIGALSAYVPGKGEEAEYHFLHAMALKGSGKQLQAIDLFRRSFRLGSGRLKERALLETGRAYFEKGLFHEAGLYASLFLKLFPASSEGVPARILLAESRSASGRFDSALREFERSGDRPEALFGKANVLQRKGKVTEAAKAYERALAADPAYLERSEESRCLLGENLLGRNDPAAARGYLLSVNWDRYRERVAVALGAVALAESKPEEAVRLFDSARNAPDREVRRRALLLLGVAHDAAGNAKPAVDGFEEVVAKHPDSRESDEALVRLARIRRKEGDVPKASALLRKALLRSSPIRKEAVSELSALLLETKGRDAAMFVRVWDNTGRIAAPEMGEDALRELADALEGAGDRSAPLHEWLSRNGSRAGRLASLSWMARRAAADRDAGRAQECVAEAKRQGASGDDMRRFEAFAAFAGNDRRRAADLLLSVSLVGKEDLKPLRELLPSSSDYGKAVAVYGEALSRLGGEAGDFLRLADLLYARGRKQEAMGHYRSALAKEPGNEWAAYRVALIAGRESGEELLGRIRSDRALSRMARATLKDWKLEREAGKQ